MKISPVQIEDFNTEKVTSKFKKQNERGDPKSKKVFRVLSEENQYAIVLKEALFSDDKPKIMKDALRLETKYSVFTKDGLLYSKFGYPTNPFAPDQTYVNLS